MIYLFVSHSVISAVVYGAMAVGEANSFTPNYAKAKMAASHILMLINRVPVIDNASEDGDKPVFLLTCTWTPEYTVCPVHDNKVSNWSQSSWKPSMKLIISHVDPNLIRLRQSWTLPAIISDVIQRDHQETSMMTLEYTNVLWCDCFL